jgi:MurNAc alpha-1-phosphate uridylyltransferase
MKIAMILAAGRGERLKPITLYKPKALCMMGNNCLLEHHINKLIAADFKRIVINHAYLGWQIRQLFNKNKYPIEIILTPEPVGGLETGGGIVNALEYLGDDPFLVINADIFTDFDFSSLHLHADTVAHLLLVNKPAYSRLGDFGLEANYLSNNNRLYTFAGIGVYNPQIFYPAKFGRFSLTPIIRSLVDKKKVSGEIFNGKWIDIGTPERMALANSLL